MCKNMPAHRRGLYMNGVLTADVGDRVAAKREEAPRKAEDGRSERSEGSAVAGPGVICLTTRGPRGDTLSSAHDSRPTVDEAANDRRTIPLRAHGPLRGGRRPGGSRAASVRARTGRRRRGHGLARVVRLLLVRVRAVCGWPASCPAKQATFRLLSLSKTM